MTDQNSYLDMDLLRFTTAGSVDDGKSTLIGRLFHDTKAIFEDQLEAIEKSTGKTSERIMMPMQAGDVNQTWANVEHLKADYDYQPSTALEVGVEAFVDWYKSYYS